MNYFTKTKTKVNLHFRYNTDIVSAVKLIFNDPKFNPDTKIWSFPLTPFNLSRLEHLELMYGFVLKDEENEFRKEELSNISIASKCEIEYIRDKVNSFCFKIKPYDYQIKGVASMLKAKSSINGDEMGLGKTGQAIMCIELEGLFPALVICPSSVKYNWKKEWGKWVDGRRVGVIESNETKKHKNDWDADVIVINYDILKKFEVTLRKKFGSLVVDESQYVKNPKSQRSKVVRNIAKRVDYRFLLTGTPIMNRPEELMHPLKILNVFESEFGGWKKFIFKYCDAHYGAFGLDTSGCSNPLELNYKMRKSFYIQRDKIDVSLDMPKRVDSIITIPFLKVKDFNSACFDILGYILKNRGEEAMLRAEGAPQLVMSNELKKISIDGKLHSIKSWLYDFLQSTNKKIIVFGRRTSQLEELSKEFDCPLINGLVNAKKKQDLVEEFITSDKQILFGNIKSLGTGVDGLQHSCSNVAFIELPDEPTELEQAIARVHRTGQKSSVSVYMLFGEECVDQIMWEVLKSKYEVVNAVNKGEGVSISSNRVKDMNREIYKMVKNGIRNK